MTERKQTVFNITLVSNASTSVRWKTCCNSHFDLCEQAAAPERSCCKADVLLLTSQLIFRLIVQKLSVCDERDGASDTMAGISVSMLWCSSTKALNLKIWVLSRLKGISYPYDVGSFGNKAQETTRLIQLWISQLILQTSRPSKHQKVTWRCGIDEFQHRTLVWTNDLPF